MKILLRIKLFLFATVLTMVQIRMSSVHAEPPRIVIGWTGPLTGSGAVIDIDSVEAARMVVESVNSLGGIKGRKLRLVVEDVQYETSKAVTAYTKLAEVDKAVAIIANTYGDAFSNGMAGKLKLPRCSSCERVRS